MKNLKELKGVKVLNKSQQKAITGGIACYKANGDWACGTGCCVASHCVPASRC
jgi:hypothetical protein